MSHALASIAAHQASTATSSQGVQAARAELRKHLDNAKRNRDGIPSAKRSGVLGGKSAKQTWLDHNEPLSSRHRAEYDRKIELIKKHRAGIAAAAASVASEAAALPGLVSCSTTLTSENLHPHSELAGVPQHAHGVIEMDTAKARIRKMSRAVMKSTDIHRIAQQLEFEGRRSATIMATMTYAPGNEPEAEDVTKCLRNAAMWFKRKYAHLPKDKQPKLRFTWVAELTKKGRLHYHVLFFLPPMVKLPKFDVRGWWTKGSTRLEWARCANSYMAKYASKGSVGRGAMPKGFRMHGSGGLTKDERNEKRYHCAPSWVREFFKLEDRARVCPGGGWVSPVTGEAWSSPYEIISATAGRVAIRVRAWFIDSAPTAQPNLMEQYA